MDFLGTIDRQWLCFRAPNELLKARRLIYFWLPSGQDFTSQTSDMSWQLMTWYDMFIMTLSCLFRHVQTVLTWDVAPFAAFCPAYCSILALMYRMLRWSLSLQSLTECHAFGIQILWLQILQLQLFHIIHVATIRCPFLSIFWEWSKLLKMALDFPIIVLTGFQDVSRLWPSFGRLRTCEAFTSEILAEMSKGTVLACTDMYWQWQPGPRLLKPIYKLTYPILKALYCLEPKDSISCRLHQYTRRSRVAKHVFTELLLRRQRK